MFRRWVVVSIMGYATCAHAGAWVEPKGEGLAIAQATYYSTGSYFDTSGEKRSQSRYTKYEFQPYVEYGALNWLTVGASAYAQAVSQSGLTNYGLADPEFFARARLWHNATNVVSIQPLIKLPSNFADDNPPRGGSRSFDAELSALYGRNLNILSANDYLDTRLGYRIRNNGLSDEWRADIALGMNVTDKIQLVPALRAVIASDIRNAAQFSESGDLDYDEAKAEFGGYYHFNDRQWVSATLFKDIAGVQTGDGYGATIGFAQRF
jgi:hypothetical protein